MKKLLIKGFLLSLVFEISRSSVSSAATEQTPLIMGFQNQPVTEVVDACRTKPKVKKPVNTKAKFNKAQCLSAPKNCYKLTPAAEKQNPNKLPVLFPISREVASLGNAPLPGGSFLATVHTSFSIF